MTHSRFRSLLDDIGQGLDAGTLPFSAAAAGVAAHVCQRLQCSSVSVWVWSEDAAPVDPGAPRVLHRAATHVLATGRAPGDAAARAVVDEADYPEYFSVLRAEAMFESIDTLADPRLARLRGTVLAPVGVRAMLDALVAFNGQPTGVFRCEQHGAPRAWTPEDRLDLKRFALELSLRRARRAVREGRASRTRLD